MVILQNRLDPTRQATGYVLVEVTDTHPPLVVTA